MVAGSVNGRRSQDAWSSSLWETPRRVAVRHALWAALATVATVPAQARQAAADGFQLPQQPVPIEHGPRRMRGGGQAGAGDEGLGLKQLRGHEGIGRGVPLSCDAYPDMVFTEVVRNNLGGFGPDAGEEGLVLKAFDAQVRRHLHVVINAGPSYRPGHKHENGLRERCGTINIQTGTDVTLKFSFRDVVTGKPAMLPQVAFTFFDLDQCEEHQCVEFITVHNLSAYRLSPNTELMVLRPMIGETIPAATFYATTAGDWFDNPRSKDTLTMEQMNRGVSVAFDHTSQVSLIFGASAGKGARYLSFMGFPGLLCIGKAATAENHFVPAGLTLPVPSGHERPPPVRWQPSEEEKLAGSITVENVDWSLLQSRQAMAAQFEVAVKRGFAEAAGEDVTPDDVTLKLEPGTIIVRATVSPPSASSGDGEGALRSRLGHSSRLCKAITEKVRAVTGIHQVASGSIELTTWHLLSSNDAKTQGAVTALASLKNVTYLPLMGSPSLLMGVKNAVSEAIAAEAGGDLKPADVDLGIFAGAVVAHITVQPPGSNGAGQGPGAATSSGAGAGQAAAVAATRARLHRRKGQVCNAVAAQVKVVNGINEVVTGDVVAQDWRLLPEEDKGSVTGTIVIQNVDYELLVANPDLVAEVEEGVRRGIASEAGGRIGPKQVDVKLFAGNVVLRAMVSPGLGGRGSSLGSAAGRWRGDTLCRAVAQEVRRVEGIREVANFSMDAHRGNVAERGDGGFPDWRHVPSDSFEGAVEGAVVSCTTAGLDYSRLLLSPVLLSGVERAVRRAVASQAGGLLTPGDLTLSLNVGSVVARATVHPPADHSASEPHLGRLLAKAVDRTIWQEVQSIDGIQEVEVEDNFAAIPDVNAIVGGKANAKSHSEETTATDPHSSSSAWADLKNLGYVLTLLGCTILLCLFLFKKRKTASGVAAKTPSRSREVYVYLPVSSESNSGDTPVSEGDAAAALLPLEVAFRDSRNETTAVKFRYCDHGMRLTRDAPPKVASFLVNSYAREKGVQAGWTIAKIGSREVDRHEKGEAIERLLKTRLERLPPAPLRLDFETTDCQMRTFLFDRQPLGIEFTKTTPFRVEHHKPDSLARECGIAVGWTLRQVGTVKLSGSTAFDTLLAYLAEGLRNLPQDPSGLRLQVDFVDLAGHTRALFLQRQPLGIRLRSQPCTSLGNGRRSGIVVNGFDFNSYAKDRGVHVGWTIVRVGEQDVSLYHSADEVVKLLRKHTSHLPLWPLRMDFVPVGSSGTRTFYFEHQPLGLEFTKSPPVKVDHFKPDSLAQALGVKEHWSVARIGDAVITKSTGLQELMGYVQAGLDHLPQEPKGLRVDFIDDRGRRRRLHFQRRPLGIVLSRQSPTIVDSFRANSYARERGVQVGWTFVRIADQELHPSAAPQEAESLLEEHSASLPLWPLRVDFDAGQASLRTVYFNCQPRDITLTSSPPFRIEGLNGGHAASHGVELGWIVLRVGHMVVGHETDHETVKRSLLDGSAHLPLPP